MPVTSTRGPIGPGFGSSSSRFGVRSPRHTHNPPHPTSNPPSRSPAEPRQSDPPPHTHAHAHAHTPAGPMTHTHPQGRCGWFDVADLMLGGEGSTAPKWVKRWFLSRFLFVPLSLSVAASLNLARGEGRHRSFTRNMTCAPLAADGPQCPLLPPRVTRNPKI